MPSEPLNFNCDLSPVDTSRPCPTAGSYVATVTNVESAAAKDSTESVPKPMWKVTFALDSSCQAYAENGAGPSLAPGFQLTENFLMYQPEQRPGKNPSPDFKIRVAKFYDAIHKTDNASRPASYGDLRTALDKKLVITIKPEVTDEFGVQARITKYGVFNG